jgi:hypothetical protein
MLKIVFGKPTQNTLTKRNPGSHRKPDIFIEIDIA